MCGIYAFYAPWLADGFGYWPGKYPAPENRLVAGVVGAAGEAELCEVGFRASRARVEAIFTDGVPDEELPIPRREIADAYGADLIGIADYENFCADRGLIVFGPEDF